METKINKNHKRYLYLKAALGFQQFMGPILVLFYLNYIGITFTQYCLIDSFLFMIVAFMEIPSGYISDKFGRKRILILGQILNLISLLILIIAKDFSGALISIILLGVGSALSSGNDYAIIFESSKSSFHKILSKSNTISLSIGIFISSLSGFLFNLNMLIPICIDVLALIILILVTYLFLHDDRKYSNELIGNKKKLKCIFSSNGFKGIKNVTLFFLMNGILFSIFRTSYTFYQPLFNEINIPIKYFGLIFSIFSIIAALGSYFSVKLTNFFNTEKKISNVIVIILLVSAIGIYYFDSYGILLFILFQQFLRGLSSPYYGFQRNNYINSESSNRTTYLSYCNFLSTIITSLSLMFSSLFNKVMPVDVSILFINCILIILLFIINCINSKLKERGIIKCYLNQQ